MKIKLTTPLYEPKMITGNQKMAQTITDAIITCGVLADTTGIFVNSNNAADIIATDVFNKKFNTFTDIKFSKLEDNWKTYSGLIAAVGRIRLINIIMLKIRAFFQHTRGEINQDEDPRLTLLPLTEGGDLIKRFNTHEQWLEDAANMEKNSIPKNFTENMEWMDWKATLINFLSSQPGRNGLPLNYVIRDNVVAIVRTNKHFIDEYVDRTPLTGKLFNADESKVHFFIT